MTNLGLSKRLLEAMTKEGFTQPTPVQERVDGKRQDGKLCTAYLRDVGKNRRRGKAKN